MMVDVDLFGSGPDGGDMSLEGPGIMVVSWVRTGVGPVSGLIGWDVDI